MTYRPPIAYRPQIEIIPNWWYGEEFQNRINQRLMELSERHIVDDVQFTGDQVLIRYHADKWAPTEDEE